MDGPESELESFRQQWRKEVSARLKSGVSDGMTRKSFLAGPGRSQKQVKKVPCATSVHSADNSNNSEYERREFHDLEVKEEILKLENEYIRQNIGNGEKEPNSALEHYEKAVQKEGEGRLGDSVSLYRKAYKLDSRVHEAYKNKHFPSSASASASTSALQDLNPSNTQYTVPLSTSSALHVPPSSISDLLEAFSFLSILPAISEGDLSPVSQCPIALIPEEILREIYSHLALVDLASFARLAQVCKRFTYLVLTEESVWKQIVLSPDYGMAAMYYSYACDLSGSPLLQASTTTLQSAPKVMSTVPDLTPSFYATYRAQFRHRPRIRFNGCYISTVNYTRPGAASQSQVTWNSPIHIVTYYRYLRFFRDGTAISLLSTAEPADVVHHLSKENMHDHHTGALPSAVMKDALRGRWRLSGRVPLEISGSTEAIEPDKGPGEYVREHFDNEDEGVLFVETEGVVPKYMWKMEFALGSAGRKEGTRNNKLTWRGFWSYNRLADDWGEFMLKNDRAFYWSRVKSY